MQTFLWTVLVLLALDALAALIWLARGRVPERRLSDAAITVVINVAFLVWAAVLLSGR